MPTFRTYYILIHDGTSINHRLKHEVPELTLDEMDSLSDTLEYAWAGSFKNIATKDTDVRVLCVPMPYPNDASYEEWQERIQHVLHQLLLSSQIYFVGHGLGALFLQMFLAQNKIKQTIIQTHFVAPEYKQGVFLVNQNWGSIIDQCQQNHIWHSIDDTQSTFRNAIKYHERLLNSHLHTFRDRGHFTDNEFPELLDSIVNSQ